MAGLILPPRHPSLWQRELSPCALPPNCGIHSALRGPWRAASESPLAQLHHLPSGLPRKLAQRPRSAALKSRLLVQRERGAPHKVLGLCELPMPALGEGQLALEVLAAPINPVDHLRCRGFYPLLPPLPGVLGSEGVARVVGLGPGVDPHWRCGDLVLLPIRMGTFRSHAHLHQRQLLRLPPKICPLQASMLAICPTSALIMLEQSGLQAGDTLINAPASGAVGQCIAQLAKLSRLHAIHLVQDARWHPTLQALDPNSTVQNLKDFLASCPPQNPRRRPKAAFDGIGGQVSAHILQHLAPHTTLHSYGALSRRAPAVDLQDLLFRGVHLQGFWLYRWAMAHGSKALAQRRHQLAELMAQGQLRIKVSRCFALEDFAQAFEASRARGLQGRVLFLPNGADAIGPHLSA